MDVNATEVHGDRQHGARLTVYYASRFQQACPKEGSSRFPLCLLFASSIGRKQPGEMFASVKNSSSRTEPCRFHVGLGPSDQSSAPGRETLPRPARKEPSRGAGPCGVHYHVPPTQTSPRTHDRRLVLSDFQQSRMKYHGSYAQFRFRQTLETRCFHESVFRSIHQTRSFTRTLIRFHID